MKMSSPDATGKKAMKQGIVGAPMPHEAHELAPDNILHSSLFKRGTVHPDSKGSNGMHGDGTDCKYCGH